MAAATHFVFSAQPQDDLVGGAGVSAVDDTGATDAGYVGDCTLSLLDINGTNGELDGTLTVAFAGGQAEFDDLSITYNGVYALLASGGTLPQAESDFFDYAAADEPPAAYLTFSPQPADDLAAPVVVKAKNVNGIVDPAWAGTITLELRDAVLLPIGNASLTGVTAIATTSGTATFNSLSVLGDRASYRIRATGGTLAGVSDVFTAGKTAFRGPAWMDSTTRDDNWRDGVWRDGENKDNI